MAKIFPKAYTTTKYHAFNCGCKVDIEVEKQESGEIFLTPTIKYCRLHTLGVDIAEALKEI